MKSHLLEGRVRHRRLQPVTYELDHGVYYAALDIGELDAVDRRSRIIGRNRAAVLGLRDRDHLDPDGGDLAAQARARLRAQGVDPDGWQVTLVTNLRVLGYVFNPASFWLCRDPEGELRIVLVEVHNTHGERHVYALRLERRGRLHVASMDKRFYVSPFIDMVGRYTVRIEDGADRLRIAIDEDAGGSRIIHTALDLRRLPLRDRTLLRLLVRYPLVTHKTIIMIHWHALRLWRRGLRFHRHAEATR